MVFTTRVTAFRSLERIGRRQRQLKFARTLKSPHFAPIHKYMSGLQGTLKHCFLTVESLGDNVIPDLDDQQSTNPRGDGYASRCSGK